MNKGVRVFLSNTARTLVDAEPSATGVEEGSQPGLCEEGHTLAFVWDASKLPHRLRKAPKAMKESIKVTLFLQPTRTRPDS